MHNAFPIADIPGQRAIRVPVFDPNASVGCPRCHGLAQMIPHASPGNTCPCGYIELAWMAYPSDSGNVAYVAGLRAENARLRAGLESLREPHAADCITHHRGLENSCTCIPDRLTIFHNARIDALLKGDG